LPLIRTGATTTPETTMRLFWKLWINTARSMLSVAGAR
jgi:hypothetical protein